VWLDFGFRFFVVDVVFVELGVCNRCTAIFCGICINLLTDTYFPKILQLLK